MKVIYPGTFDPVTFGHIDIIERALKVFDEVVVAVVRSPSKDALFTFEERIDLVKAVVDAKRVTVDGFDGLIVEYARRHGINVLLRGLRMLSDFEYEFQMALTNRKLDSSIETLYLMTGEDYSYISSRLLKEVFVNGGDVSHFAPQAVISALEKKFGK
jgi:pantetheine-phosphate adenylyltransferase